MKIKPPNDDTANDEDYSDGEILIRPQFHVYLQGLLSYYDEGVGVGDKGSDVGNDLVDAGGDVVRDNNELVVGEGAGTRGLRMNEEEREGEGEGRERIFR